MTDTLQQQAVGHTLPTGMPIPLQLCPTDRVGTHVFCTVPTEQSRQERHKLGGARYQQPLLRHNNTTPAHDRLGEMHAPHMPKRPHATLSVQHDGWHATTPDRAQARIQVHAVCQQPDHITTP